MLRCGHGLPSLEMVLGPGAGDVHAAQVEAVPGAANADRGFVLVPRAGAAGALYTEVTRPPGSL